MSRGDLPDWVQRHRWEVGDRLRLLRLARSLTQEQLAESAGLDNKTISRAENGHIALDLDMLARIAQVLDVPSWQLLKDTDQDGDADQDDEFPADPVE